MKIILLKDVRGVGQIHEVKNVAEGYALNYLFPNRLAEAATPERIAQFESQRAATEAKRAAEEQALGLSIKELNGSRIEISARATEKGGLFKSVDSTVIARAIREQKGADIPAETVTISTPIKTTGEHTVELRSKSGKGTITLVIGPTA